MDLETTTEAAKRLKKSRPTIRRYVINGALAGVMVGRQAFVFAGALIDEMQTPPRGWQAHKKQRAAEMAKIMEEVGL